MTTGANLGPDLLIAGAAMNDDSRLDCSDMDAATDDELDADCPACGVPLLLEQENPDVGRCPECDKTFPIIY